jgi:hypothetical protein
MNGLLYAPPPDGTNVDVTPRVAGTNFYTFTVEPTKYSFKSECEATFPTNRDRMTVGVGERVKVWFEPTLRTDSCWQAVNGGVSNPVLHANVAVANIFTAASNAPGGSVTAEVITSVLGARVTNSFIVLEPKGVDHAAVISAKPFSPGPFSGAGMNLKVFLAPSTVSFYRLEGMEVGLPATNMTGYFTNHYTPSTLSHSHWGADKWFPIMANNSWGLDWDQAGWTEGLGHPPEGWPPGGEFEWVIPGKWRVKDTPRTNDLAESWKQSFVLETNGTMSVTKFKHTVKRWTDGRCTVDGVSQ